MLMQLITAANMTVGKQTLTLVRDHTGPTAVMVQDVGTVRF